MWCGVCENVLVQLNKKLSLSDVGNNALNESINRAITNFGAKHYDDAALVTWRLLAGGGSGASSESAPSASASVSVSAQATASGSAGSS